MCNADVATKELINRAGFTADSDVYASKYTDFINIYEWHCIEWNSFHRTTWWKYIAYVKAFRLRIVYEESVINKVAGQMGFRSRYSRKHMRDRKNIFGRRVFFSVSSTYIGYRIVKDPEQSNTFGRSFAVMAERERRFIRFIRQIIDRAVTETPNHRITIIRLRPFFRRYHGLYRPIKSNRSTSAAKRSVHTSKIADTERFSEPNTMEWPRSKPRIR